MENEVNWKAKLEESAAQMEIDPARKRAALMRVAQAAGQKEVKYWPGWLEICRLQLVSVPKSIWMMQALVLFMFYGAEELFRRKMHTAEGEVFPMLSWCMALGCLVMAQELSRHFSCRMAEIEQTCALNLSQLWLMRVSAMSGLDVLAAVGLGLARGRDYGVGWFPFSVYVLTPFFLANAVLLMLFTVTRKKRRTAGFGAVVLTGSCMGVQAFVPEIYDKIWLPVWVLLLAAAIWFCIMGLGAAREQIEGEKVCWN